jgi:dynein heavy chain
LFTDAHVLEEGFLELVNNILTIGMVPALFDEEGKTKMGDIVRDEAKKLGITETKEELWNYFLEKVKDNLHLSLCMSPAGETLRIRCRNFPGLVNNTGINWFFTWPKEALESVARYYLEETEIDVEGGKDKVIDHIVMVHTSV